MPSLTSLPKRGKSLFTNTISSHSQKKICCRHVQSLQQQEEGEGEGEEEEGRVKTEREEDEGEGTEMGGNIFFHDPPTTRKMKLRSSSDLVYVASLLRSCTSLHHAHLLHSYIIRCGIEHTVFLQNLILEMYGRCGSPSEAQSWFDSMGSRDQFSWNFMLAIYARSGKWELSLKLFDQLCVEGMAVDDYILSSTLSACICGESFGYGKRLHARIVGSSFESIDVVQNALINSYGKCGCFRENDNDNDSVDMRRMFDMITKRSIISWSAMILAYSKWGLCEFALRLWNQMLQEGMAPGKATILAILDACSNRASLLFAKQVHASLLGCPFVSDVKVKSALVHVYGKCNSMSDALKTFEELAQPNVVPWTSMITGHAQSGNSEEALRLFEQMQQEGVLPNSVTFVSVVDAYAKNGVLIKAKQMHAHIKHNGYDSDVIVATAIVNMYGSCGSPEDARRMFEEMPDRNLVTWNAMLSVYAQHGLGREAFELFSFMLKKDNLKPNKVTFISMLSACATEGALIEGKWLHDQIVRQSAEKDVAVCNALINAYSKCGKLELAHNIFQRMCGRNVISWSSMIAAFAQYGYGEKVMQMLWQMKEERIEPSPITFKVILLACSHGGLPDDAYCYLISMDKMCGLKPDGEHYDCVVDLMGRLGRLDDVEDLISKIPVQPSPISWLTLLGACSSQGDLRRGEHAANHVVEIYPECSAPYVILSNLYAAAGRTDDAERLLSRLKCKGLMKIQDVSCIGVDVKDIEFIPINGLVYDHRIYV